MEGRPAAAAERRIGFIVRPSIFGPALQYLGPIFTLAARAVGWRNHGILKNY